MDIDSRLDRAADLVVQGWMEDLVAGRLNAGERTPDQWLAACTIDSSVMHDTEDANMRFFEVLAAEKLIASDDTSVSDEDAATWNAMTSRLEAAATRLVEQR